MQQAGLPVDVLHGEKAQTHRQDILEAFRKGETPVLIATDLAARGIDIEDISHIINFDLPNEPETFVHRIGRTARAGREGEAIAFCAPDEADLLHQIQKLMKAEVPVASGTSPIGNMPDSGGRRAGGPGGNRGRGHGKPGNTPNPPPAKRRRPRRRKAA